LETPVAGLFGAIGIVTVIYSSLAAGVLRGRRHVPSAASIMPVAAFCEVATLAAFWLSGVGVTTLSAFGSFCLGNVIGLAFAVALTVRTAPRNIQLAGLSDHVPTARRLLGFSLWLAAAAGGLSILPLVLRSAAALDSYTQVAVVDIALLVFMIPQRIGAIVALAVIPHASRAVRRGANVLRITNRQQVLVAVPFAILALVMLVTPSLEWFFDAIGRPEYNKSTTYIALVMLAGPARVLYGIVAGVLIGHGEGRFLGLNVMAGVVIGATGIAVAALLGSTAAAIIAFVAAVWLMYLVALARFNRLSPAHRKPLAGAEPARVQPQFAQQSG
jgi:O-antigen/teichoic acid export membrane protein